MIPAAENTLRRRPPHVGQVVSASSVKRCTTSSRSSHAVQAYWYVGTGSSLLREPSRGWHSSVSTAKGTGFWLVAGLAVPTGQFSASADGAQPALRGVARPGRGHDQELVSRPQHGGRGRYGAVSVSDHQRDRRLGRQPQLEDLHAVQLRVRRDAD